jgi:hypothetical protein
VIAAFTNPLPASQRPVEYYTSFGLWFTEHTVSDQARLQILCQVKLASLHSFFQQIMALTRCCEPSRADSLIVTISAERRTHRVSRCQLQGAGAAKRRQMTTESRIHIDKLDSLKKAPTESIAEFVVRAKELATNLEAM